MHHHELKSKPAFTVTNNGVSYPFWVIPADKLTNERMRAYQDTIFFLEMGLTPMQLKTVFDNVLHEATDKKIPDAKFRETVKGYVTALSARAGITHLDSMISAATVFIVGENESIQDYSREQALLNASLIASDIQAVFFCLESVMKRYKALPQLSKEQLRQMASEGITLASRKMWIL